MNKIALWVNVCADDWTAERAIITSNGGNGSRMKGVVRYLCNYMFFMNICVNCFTIFLKENPGAALMIFCRTKSQCSGRSEEGVHLAQPPPSAARNFLNFMPFFGKFGKIVFWRPLEGQRLLL